MSNTKWEKLGVHMVSKSGRTLSTCINGKWGYAKINEVMEVLEGKRKFAEINAPVKEGE